MLLVEFIFLVCFFSLLSFHNLSARVFSHRNLCECKCVGAILVWVSVYVGMWLRDVNCDRRNVWCQFNVLCFCVMVPIWILVQVVDIFAGFGKLVNSFAKMFHISCWRMVFLVYWFRVPFHPNCCGVCVCWLKDQIKTLSEFMCSCIVRILVNLYRLRINTEFSVALQNLIPSFVNALFFPVEKMFSSEIL